MFNLNVLPQGLSLISYIFCRFAKPIIVSDFGLLFLYNQIRVRRLKLSTHLFERTMH